MRGGRSRVGLVAMSTQPTCPSDAMSHPSVDAAAATVASSGRSVAAGAGVDHRRVPFGTTRSELEARIASL